jgi:hypothetical protein
MDTIWALAIFLADRQYPQVLDLTSGAGRNRTADASLFRAALYRLSYRPKSGVSWRSLTTASRRLM